MGIDWAKVSEIALDAGLTVIFGAIVGFAVNLWRLGRYNQQERILLELARLRRSGVAIRNRGERATLTGPTFDAWKSEIDEWKTALIAKANEFSPVEGERLDTLDRMVALPYPNIQNPDQVRLLRDTSETLKRLDRLLERRFRPTPSP